MPCSEICPNERDSDFQPFEAHGQQDSSFTGLSTKVHSQRMRIIAYEGQGPARRAHRRRKLNTKLMFSGVVDHRDT